MSRRREVRVVMRIWDDLLRAKEFSACDGVLAITNPEPLDVALTILTMTHPARDRLPARLGLLQRVSDYLKVTRPTEAEALLRGL